MPWQPQDARSHTKKAKTPAQKRRWARIATEVLSGSDDEGKAIRIANAMMKRKRQ